MFVTLRDELKLHVPVEGGGDPILLIHGFTGSSLTWGENLIHGVMI